MACIYCIKNDINTKVYIGKTIYTIEHRFKEHIKDAYKHKCNSKLHRAIVKYGKEHFYVILLEECKEEISGKREQYYIQLYDSVKNGYNISYGGEGESQVDIQLVEDLFLQGYNFKQIAEKTGHSPKTIANRLKALGYEAKTGGINKPSGNRNKGKTIEFNNMCFNSITLLAEYLQQNVDEFKDKEISTIIKGISKNSKRGTRYCGYIFHRL
jgi:group I intron endonuclease